MLTKIEKLKNNGKNVTIKKIENNGKNSITKFENIERDINDFYHQLKCDFLS